MLYGIRRAVGPPAYNPATATGLTCWLRDVYTSSAGARSQWTDKTGNGFHFTATSTNKPTDNVADSGINGKDSLLFTPANYTFMTGPAKSSLITSTNFTIYFVAKAFNPTTGAGANSGSKSRLLLGDATTSGNSNFAIQYINTSAVDKYRMLWAGDDTGISAANGGILPITNSMWKRFCLIGDSVAGQFYFREAGQAANNVSSGTLNSMAAAFKLGGYAASGTADSGSPFDGYMAEVLFCNVAHTTTEQDGMFNYQASYFGL